MEDRVQQFAEQMDQLGLGEYVWDPSPTCPQGHPNMDIECGGRDTEIGQLCSYCWNELAHQTSDPVAGFFSDADYAQMVIDPTYFQAWRIGRVSKPLLEDIAALLDIARMWCAQTDARWKLFQSTPDQYYAEMHSFSGRVWYGEGNTPTYALGIALMDAADALYQAKYPV